MPAPSSKALPAPSRLLVHRGRASSRSALAGLETRRRRSRAGPGAGETGRGRGSWATNRGPRSNGSPSAGGVGTPARPTAPANTAAARPSSTGSRTGTAPIRRRADHPLGVRRAGGRLSQSLGRDASRPEAGGPSGPSPPHPDRRRPPPPSQLPGPSEAPGPPPRLRRPPPGAEIQVRTRGSLSIQIPGGAAAARRFADDSAAAGLASLSSRQRPIARSASFPRVMRRRRPARLRRRRLARRLRRPGGPFPAAGERQPFTAIASSATAATARSKT